MSFPVIVKCLLLFFTNTVSFLLPIAGSLLISFFEFVFPIFSVDKSLVVITVNYNNNINLFVSSRESISFCPLLVLY